MTPKNKKTARSSAPQTSNSRSSIPEIKFEVFDFEAKWDSIKAYLDDPKLNKVLQRCLDAMLAHQANLRVHLGLNPKPWQIKADPSLGPWQYGQNLATWGEVKPLTKHYGICPCCGEEGELCIPEPGSLRWYQVAEAAPWHAVWQKELGQMVFPKLRWEIATDGFFGVAFGVDEKGALKVVFDMMHAGQSICVERLMEFIVQNAAH